MYHVIIDASYQKRVLTSTDLTLANTLQKYKGSSFWQWAFLFVVKWKLKIAISTVIQRH